MNRRGNENGIAGKDAGEREPLAEQSIPTRCLSQRLMPKAVGSRQSHDASVRLPTKTRAKRPARSRNDAKPRQLVRIDLDTQAIMTPILDVEIEHPPILIVVEAA